MSRSVRKYTEEFKQEAINLALKSPSIATTASELGIFRLVRCIRGYMC